MSLIGQSNEGNDQLSQAITCCSESGKHYVSVSQATDENAVRTVAGNHDCPQELTYHTVHTQAASALHCRNSRKPCSSVSCFERKTSDTVVGTGCLMTVMVAVFFFLLFKRHMLTLHIPELINIILQINIWLFK